ISTAKPSKAALAMRWHALYFELTNVFQQGAGVILTTLITRDAGMISVYGIYHMVTVGLWGVLKMATTGIYSIFGNLLISETKSVFQRAYRDFECLYHMANTILFGVAAVLIVPFVNLYTHGVTDVNYNVPLLGLLMIAEALANQCKMPMDLMISATGKFREVRGQCVAQVIATLVLGVSLGLFGLRFGAEGAACGALCGVIIATLLRAAMQLQFVPKQITGIPWQESALRILRMFLTTTLIALPCLLLVEPPRRFFSWFMYAALLVLYATAVTFAMTWLFDRGALRSLLGRLKSLLPTAQQESEK
ncbi:MAG: hypothetical protein RR367_05235, partial [Clostridia bacterium]